MENLFKQAQNAGLALERKAASEEARVSSYDTSPDTAFYQQSKANKGIDLSGAFKGLEKLVEEEAQYQRDTEFVEGQLAAQTGKALEDNASKWTTRGYKSFKRSAEINQFAGNTIARMDEFAEQSPAAFQQYLSETFDEMSSTEEDPFIKEQMSKMFTNSSNALIKQHANAREEVNKAKTISNARENIVSNMYANGGVVNKDVLTAIEQTKKSLPDIEAYGVIADAAYVSMIENGQTGLYKHLDKQGYFDKLDTDTRSQLIRTYLSITKAKQAEADKVQKEQDYMQMVESGRINNPYLSDTDRNKAMDTYVNYLNSMYPMTQEGNEQLDAAIMEISVRNNYFNHAAAKGIKDRIENPVVYVDGKPTMRAESLSAYVSAYSMKNKLGDARGDKLRTFLSEDTLATLEQVNDELPRGIANSSEDELRTAIMRVYDANNLSDREKKELKSSMYGKAYNDGKNILADKVQKYNGQGFFSGAWAKVRGVVNKSADLRALPARNPEDIEDAYQRAYMTEFKYSGSQESAARKAANKVAAKTHNILGNYVMYDTIDKSGKSVLLSEYFGMNPNDDDDDISEMLGSIILDNTEGKTNKLIRKHIDKLKVSLDQERGELNISFNYDARSEWNKLVEDPISLIIGEPKELEDAVFNATLSVESIRNFNIAKQYAKDKTLDAITATGDFDTAEAYIKAGVPMKW